MNKDFSEGLYGDKADPETTLNLWKDRESMGYPNAKRQVVRWQRKVEEYKEMQAQLAAVSQVPGTVPMNGGMVQ